eukprot:1831543-Pyramimonas_sp.AAC.1
MISEAAAGVPRASAATCKHGGATTSSITSTIDRCWSYFLRKWAYVGVGGNDCEDRTYTISWCDDYGNRVWGERYYEPF